MDSTPNNQQKQVQRKRKLNLYRLPPKNFDNKDDVIYFTNLSKVYNLAGRDEQVTALRSVSLAKGQEFYPIKK